MEIHRRLLGYILPASYEHTLGGCACGGRNPAPVPDIWQVHNLIKR
jgi:hypothetical protein